MPPAKTTAAPRKTAAQVQKEFDEYKRNLQLEIESIFEDYKDEMCDDARTDIAERLESHGVKVAVGKDYTVTVQFTLLQVPADLVQEGSWRTEMSYALNDALVNALPGQIEVDDHDPLNLDDFEITEFSKLE